MIRHSTSGSELASSRLCSGVEHVADGCQGVGVDRPRRHDRGAGNAIGRQPGAGIENMRVPLSVRSRKPRWELPLVDTARSLTSRIAIGSVDSESAHGAAMPSVRGASPQTRKIAAYVQQQAVQAAAWHQRRGAGAIDDVSLGDGIEAERAIGQPLDQCASPVRSRQAGWASSALAAASSASSGTRPLAAARDQRRVMHFDPGIEGTAAAVSPDVAGRENLEELGREPHRSPGRGLPPAELARAIIAAEDQGQAIDLAENPILGPSCRFPVVGQDSQLERRAHHVFVEERKIVHAERRPGGSTARPGTECPADHPFWMGHDTFPDPGSLGSRGDDDHRGVDLLAERTRLSDHALS